MTGESKVYLDTNLLPLREEAEDSPVWDWINQTPISEFSTEFIPLSALPRDFFDKGAAFGVEQSPDQRLAFVRATGYTPFWLGATFDNATLTRLTGDRLPTRYAGGERTISLEYSVQRRDAAGMPCDTYIQSVPRTLWESAADSRTGPGVFKTESVIDNFDTSFGHAQIIEEHSFESLPPTPGATPTRW